MNLSFSHACICICNRIHLVYVHSSSCQLSIVTHWQSKYLGLASFLQYSLCYYSFISFFFLLLSLRSRRAIRAKGLIILMSFYYDYIWLLCAPSFSLLSIFYNSCYQKKNGTRTGERTNRESYSIRSCRPTL